MTAHAHGKAQRDARLNLEAKGKLFDGAA